MVGTRLPAELIDLVSGGRLLVPLFLLASTRSQKVRHATILVAEEHFCIDCPLCRGSAILGL